MGLSQSRTRTYTGLKGRDGYPTYPGEIPLWRALECLNVDGYRAGFARKRGGASNIFNLTTGQTFSDTINAMHRHIPGSDPTVAELWAIGGSGIQRLTGGVVWTTPSLVDGFTGFYPDITFCSFKGKLFIAGDSNVDRLHVWDPADALVRRTGLATPVAPTVANTGAGTYAATIRYYKQRFIRKVGPVYYLASELSAAVSFTPSGGGTAARITKAATISESETHWQIYASEDGNAYKFLAEVAVGTTTYDDSALPSTYSGDAPPLIGTHTNWTSVRYLLATDDHLLGAGSYEVGGKTSRVWWSAVTNQAELGMTNDDESVIQTLQVSNYADLDENDGGQITGLGGPLDGRPLVFKRNSFYRLVPTGQDDVFYRPVPIFKGSHLGCIRQQTIVNGEDAAGRPCVYWLSDNGPYRIGADGPQALGDDVQDLWDTVNLEASSVVGHGVWHPTKRQVWWWIATGSSADPDTRIVFDARKGRVYEDGRVRDGWYKHTGDSCAARCSTLFSNTLGASMSRDVKPHIGRSTGIKILKCDTADLNDDGTTFQAYVDLPDTHFSGIDHVTQLGTPILVGSAGSQTIAVTLVKDYGTETVGPASTSMAASGSETRVTKVVEGIEGADAHAMRIRIGDSAAIANSWTLDAVGIRVETREPV